MKKIILIAFLFISIASFAQTSTKEKMPALIHDTTTVYIVHKIDTVKIDVIYYDGKGNLKYLPKGGYAIRQYDYCEHWTEKIRNMSGIIYDDKFNKFTKRTFSVNIIQ